MGYQISFLKAKGTSNVWFDILVNGIYIQFVTPYNMRWNEVPTKKQLIRRYYENIKYYKFNKKQVENLNKNHKKNIMNACKGRTLWISYTSYDNAIKCLKYAEKRLVKYNPLNKI